ncbi:TPA: host cell division inhibitor Icd-like protein [Escherichia coli]|nr:host cell division inhibitor Icd-like protein [Escherichia coli]
MNRPYMPVQGQGFVQLGETEKQQNRGFSGIKKAAPIRRRLSEQLTCRAKNKFEQGNYINCPARRHNCRITGKTKATGGGRQWENTKHKPEHHSDLLAGGQFDQSDSVRSQVCNDSFFLCSLRNFSRAKEQGANLSDSCSCAIFLRCPFSVCGGVFFNSLSFMVSTCIAMRRSYSHHGADSDYSDSLALRRWRRLISPCIDAMMNCDVLSPDSFTDSMAFTISCGTRAFRACDFAFVVPVAISIPLLDWWGTVYTEKAQIKLLTWATPKEYSGPHLEVVKVHKCKAPQVSLPLAGLLTTNDRKRIEVAMLNHTTHPQGRDSHNLNKYIWRFIALSTAQPRVIHIVATSEQEARQQSPAGCVMVFAARIRQEVCRA